MLVMDRAMCCGICKYGITCFYVTLNDLICMVCVAAVLRYSCDVPGVDVIFCGMNPRELYESMQRDMGVMCCDVSVMCCDMGVMCCDMGVLCCDMVLHGVLLVWCAVICVVIWV